MKCMGLFAFFALAAPVLVLHAADGSSSRHTTGDHAISAAAPAASQALQKRLRSFNSFQAHFEQTIQVDDKSKPDKLSGTLSILRPGKFRWQVESPFAQTVVADGQYIWQYDVDLEQATVRNQAGTLGVTPAGLLSGQVKSLSDAFTISRKQVGTGEIFRLVPKHDSQFQYVLLGFEKSHLVSLVLLDTLGQRTEISFSAIKSGLHLSKSLFVFHLPKGVDLVDSREHLEPSSKQK